MQWLRRPLLAGWPVGVVAALPFQRQRRLMRHPSTHAAWSAGGAAAGAGASRGAPALGVLPTGMCAAGAAGARLRRGGSRRCWAARTAQQPWPCWGCWGCSLVPACCPSPPALARPCAQPEALASDLATIASNAVAFNGEGDAIAEDAAALAAYLSAVLAGQVRRRSGALTRVGAWRRCTGLPTWQRGRGRDLNCSSPSLPRCHPPQHLDRSRT